jgi:signal peptidase II
LLLKPIHKYYLLAVVMIVIDQAIKVAVKLNFFEGEEFPLLGKLFKLHFIENNGAAFGMTFANLIPGLTDTVAKLILSIFSVVAVSVIVYLLHQVKDYPTKLPVYVSLILGGAVGNIIDRLFYGVWFASINNYEGGFLHGRVVDMFYLDLWQGVVPDWVPIWGGAYLALWPIFNWADACISTGILGIIIFQKKLFPPTEKAPLTPPETTADQPAPTE